MVAYALLLRPLGYVPSTSLFLIVGGLVLGERNYALLAFVAIAVSVSTWYLVQQVLGFISFRGLRLWGVLDMLEGILLGASAAISVYNLLMVFIGCFLGTFIGMLPGLGPMSIIAIMIPVAIQLGDPASALILLAGFTMGPSSVGRPLPS